MPLFQSFYTNLHFQNQAEKILSFLFYIEIFPHPLPTITPPFPILLVQAMPSYKLEAGRSSGPAAWEASSIFVHTIKWP
jgi:hypothetical protein